MCYLDGSGQWQLEGILSYHGNCGKRPHPAIYNSITSNISTWIRNTVGNDLMFERVTTSVTVGIDATSPADAADSTGTSTTTTTTTTTTAASSAGSDNSSIEGTTEKMAAAPAGRSEDSGSPASTTTSIDR